MKKNYAIIFLFLIGSIANAQYTKLIDFDGSANGKWPYGSLISDSSFLYGMTFQGGINGMGTIFKIKHDGTGYADLLDFAGTTNGSAPSYGSSLISDGTFLYGMTRGGGTSSLGVLFKIQTDGTGYSKLIDFTGTANGSYPSSSLISDGTFLYGMTGGGGALDLGTIFKIQYDGTGYTKLLDFAGTTNGSSPWGSLIFDGTFLYGMTRYGGINNKGTIFRIMPNGTGYFKLLDFAGATNGDNPYGSLLFDGTFLYGMTYAGGANTEGTIFKILPDGTGYFKLLDFSIAVTGRYPYGSLISDGTYLYGMIHDGSANTGNIFKIKPDGTGYSKLLDFTGTANGSYPYGSLISDGTFLYGMTKNGGANDLGTIFKYNLLCTDHTIIQTPTVCEGESLIVGSNIYTSSGFYYDTLTSFYGCDSMVTTNLTVLTDITDSVTIVPATCGNSNGSVSVAPSGGAGTYTFLWSNSDTTSTVTGLTGQPTDTLIVTITDTNGCTLTDTAIVNCIISTGINQITVSGLPFTVYPNPSNGIFTIQHSEKISRIEIINVLGETIYQSETGKTEVNLSQQPKGIYYIEIKMGEKIYTEKLIIQ